YRPHAPRRPLVRGHGRRTRRQPDVPRPTTAPPPRPASRLLPGLRRRTFRHRRRGGHPPPPRPAEGGAVTDRADRAWRRLARYTDPATTHDRWPPSGPARPIPAPARKGACHARPGHWPRPHAHCASRAPPRPAPPARPALPGVARPCRRIPPRLVDRHRRVHCRRPSAARRHGHRRPVPRHRLDRPPLPQTRHPLADPRGPRHRRADDPPRAPCAAFNVPCAPEEPRAHPKYHHSPGGAPDARTAADPAPPRHPAAPAPTRRPAGR